MTRQLILFLSIIGVNLSINKVGYNQRCNTANHHHDEEVGIANGLLYITCYHTRQKHTGCHEGGTDGIVGGLEFPFTEIHHVEHVSCESKAIAKLFNRQ